MDSCGQFCDGYRAHLPGKVHPKAVEYSRLVPNVLWCTLLPCSSVLAEIFENDSPTVNDMALFFSPGDFERTGSNGILPAGSILPCRRPSGGSRSSFL
ncbi:uncharacterized protein Pyn_03530 [Prunus yedoensis var. nudiflora]|uniref:AIPP2-like SPOC-like domain-containing protein n=1 Tax=Prunus yedoensis var. nudiflora TaxID=2094558 RepID=A0A314YR20_PRUYE|nr:uncharacterized protein Pyn_03530 [Prunus yedoensis var. nudiflora]